MLETVTPIQFHDIVTSGRTKPSRVFCEKKNEGDLVEVVAKFSAGCERKEAGLAMEVVAACLAADLGLPIAIPYLLDVQRAWIGTVTDLRRRDLMARSSSIAFGSTFVGPGFRSWSASDKLSAAMTPTAAAIFAFDAFINNADRRDGNPNCLIRGHEIRIFDHELGFVYRGILGWQEPWRVGALAAFTTPGNHIFYRPLKGLELNLEPIKAAWSSLDDARLAAYRGSIPAVWADATPVVDDAISLIQGVRDHIDEALVEVRRILA
ncbi:MAG: hypothetical protein JSR89_18255 [Proteobacteria bacterium]|nr:hypothetical protein [Pseudomonadota bacterium]